MQTQKLSSVFKSLTLTYTSHMPHHFSDSILVQLPWFVLAFDEHMLGLFSVDLNLLFVLQQNIVQIIICAIFVQSLLLVENANAQSLIL